jgi:hypothetical protein
LNLDIETRDLISERINAVYEKQDFLGTVNWILKTDDDRVSTREDLENLALGYSLGALMNVAYDVARHKKLEKKYDEKYKEEMERKLRKEATKAIAEMNRRLEEMKAKGIRPVANELTDEETDDIRSMLLQMIPRFRWRIRKELAMRRI